MLKYLCFIILGILIYILLNSEDGFSIGGLNPGDECDYHVDNCYDDKSDGTPGTCEIAENPCYCTFENVCELHADGGAGGGAGGGDAISRLDPPSLSPLIQFSITSSTNDFRIRSKWFLNSSAVPVNVEYIQFKDVLEFEDPIDYGAIIILLKTQINYLPPIYLGKFRKPSRGILDSTKVKRHFFIIDKKIYYYKEQGSIFMIQKVGEGRLPITLLDSRRAQLKLAASTWKNNSYLRITGTNDLKLYMYPELDDTASSVISQTLETVQQIIEAYMNGVSSDTQCSVQIEEEETSTRSNLPMTGYTPPEPPTYSIDSTGIICESYNSVFNINLNYVRYEDDLETNVLVLETRPDALGSVPIIDTSTLGVLEYNGVPLLYITPISSGTYGRVYVASSIPYINFNSTNEANNVGIAVAVKLYNDPIDPEIIFIDSIHRVAINNCLDNGEIINAIILRRGGVSTAIMEFMDGTLFELLNNVRSVNITAYKRSRVPFQIVKRLMILLKCIDDAGYVYLDLKPENILYKCYKNNHFKISLGDLGSILRKGPELIGRILNIQIAMAYMPYITEPGTDENNIIVWLFGLNILDIYGISTAIASGYKILNPRFLPQRDSDFLNEKGLTDPSPGYYSRVALAVSKAVSALESYRIATNDKEIEFIQKLLERIFVPIPNRITFEEINTLFTEFNLLVSSETPESPVTVEQIQKLFCNIIRTDTECTQSTLGQVCTWDATQSPPCN